MKRTSLLPSTPLTLTRGCFLQLPKRFVAKGELPSVEKHYRETNPAFHHREGYYFFFQFNTSYDRNKFLKALAVSYEQMNVEAKADTYKP